MDDKKTQECVDDCLGMDGDMETYQFKHFFVIAAVSAILISIIVYLSPYWFESVQDTDSIGRYLSITGPRVIVGILAMIFGTCLWDYVTPGHSVRNTLKDARASAIIIAAMMGGIAYIVR